MAFWSAARMLAQGSGADIYNPDAIRTVQRTVEVADVVPFVHPPHFLLWVWPLGFFSYPSAWITWSAVTFGFWMVATRRLFPTMSWPIAGFPGALIAAWHAQTGFLTSGIQALIASQLGNHPFRAGLCIGLLIIKPHVAILMPFALLAARMWSAIAGAAISILISSLAAWMCFGSAVWLAYPSSWAVSQHLIEAGDHAFFLRQVTVYAMLRAWDMPEAAAVAQGLATTLSILVIWRFWSIDAPIERKVALLLALTPLATPYLFSYDLPFLVVPVLWLVAHYKQRWSRPALVALYVSPLLCRAVALPLSVNPTPLVCIAMAVLIYRQLVPGGTDERFDTS